MLMTPQWIHQHLPEHCQLLSLQVNITPPIIVIPEFVTKIYRSSYYGQEVYYVAAGATNIDPPVNAASVQCQDPSSN